MPVPDVNDPRPAFVQIADDLRGQIRDGRIEVGSRLASQRELAEEVYKVAPGTIQSALKELADDGIVSRGSTRGTFVLKMPGEKNASAAFEELVTGKLAEILNRLEAVEKIVQEGRDD